MKVTVTRSSVAAGDDVDAPHERIFDLFGWPPIPEVVDVILRSRYLPVVAGGAVWSMEVEDWCGVIEVSDTGEARVVHSFAPRTPIRADDRKLLFWYHAQEPAAVVFEHMTR